MYATSNKKTVTCYKMVTEMRYRIGLVLKPLCMPLAANWSLAWNPHVSLWPQTGHWSHDGEAWISTIRDLSAFTIDTIKAKSEMCVASDLILSAYSYSLPGSCAVWVMTWVTDTDPLGPGLVRCWLIAANCCLWTSPPPCKILTMII